MIPALAGCTNSRKGFISYFASRKQCVSKKAFFDNRTNISQKKRGKTHTVEIYFLHFFQPLHGTCEFLTFVKKSCERGFSHDCGVSKLLGESAAWKQRFKYQVETDIDPHTLNNSDVANK